MRQFPEGGVRDGEHVVGPEALPDGLRADSCRCWIWSRSEVFGADIDPHAVGRERVEVTPG